MALVKIGNLRGPQGVRGPMGALTAEDEVLLSDAVASAVTAIDARDEAVAARNDLVAVEATNDGIMAAVLADPESATSGQLNATIADDINASLSGSALDIWDAQDVPSTFAQWESELDSELQGAAVKTAIGVDSYGANLVQYVAGEGARRVLILAGTHPFETLGVAAAKQYFVKFATSNNPAMVALRQRVTICLIPATIAGNFANNVPGESGRLNVNGVNVNRNYDFNWSLSGDPEKGSAAFSENESQRVKAVIDAFRPSLIIDCHNYGNTGQSDFGYAMPSAVHANKAVVLKAVEAWQRSTNFTGTIARLSSGTRDPNLGNWSQLYNRFTLGDSTALSVTLECLSTLGGSTTHSYTREAMRLYASMVQELVLSWLESGQHEVAPIEAISQGVHSIAGGYDTPVSEGGRLVNSSEWTPLDFAIVSGVSGLNGVEFMLPYPGRLHIQASVNLSMAGGSGRAPARVDIGISSEMRGDPERTGPTASTVASGYLDDSGRTLTLNAQAYFNKLELAGSGNTVGLVRLWMRSTDVTQVRVASNNMTTGTGGGARMIISVKPDFVPFNQPFDAF